MAYLGKEAINRATGTSKDSFSGNGSTTAFTMSRTVHLVTDIEVFVDNVQQEPTTAYTVSGTTLTFTEAPANGTNNIYVIHRSGNNDSMTVQSGISPTFGNVTIADGGTIGSASDNDAISINSSGRVTLTNNLTIPNDGNIGSIGDTDAIAISSAGVATFSGGIKVANDGNIGSVGDADSMAISSGGVVTFSQIPANASNPAFRVYRSADQTGISDATITKVQFDAEEFDIGGYYDNSTNYRYTPLIAGYYFFVSVIQVSGTGIDQITNNLQKNGTAISWNTIMNSDSGAGYSGSSVMNSSLLFMNGSTDYVESHIFADVSSGTVTVEGVNPYRSHFEGFLVNRTA